VDLQQATEFVGKANDAAASERLRAGVTFTSWRG
jgi:hypothetical protein